MPSSSCSEIGEKWGWERGSRCKHRYSASWKSCRTFTPYSKQHIWTEGSNKRLSTQDSHSSFRPIYQRPIKWPGEGDHRDASPVLWQAISPAMMATATGSLPSWVA